MTPSRVQLDARELDRVVADLLARRLGYVPEWAPAEKGAGAAIAQIVARYVSAIVQRLNQAPEKNKLAFLDLLGIDLIAAQAARAPIVLRLADKAPDSRLAAGTRLAAPPPPESSDQIVFETERATGLAAARLQQVVSLWPGRDQYIDHSLALLAGLPFQPFKKPSLQDTPHALYLAHDTLLAFAGQSRIDVEFELTTLSSEQLDILWEYWDGKVWRGFKAMRPACLEEQETKLDGTAGLTRSGRVRLETDCAETAKTTVNGIEAYWIRGRLTEPLPPNPEQVLPEVENIKLRSVVTQPVLCSTVEEHVIGFESLVADTTYGQPDQARGEVIFTESGVPVSVEEYKFSGSSGTFGSCTVIQALPEFGSGQTMRMRGINLKFDFAALGGTVDLVRFEYADRGGTNNISVNGATIFEDLENIPPVIAPGVRFTRTAKPSDPNLSIAEITLAGPITTLLIGGENFDLDNIRFRLNRANGLLPDKAFADAAPLDLTKAFFPLGPQPRPGSVFYFSNEELFSKPKARVRLFIKTAPTPEQSLNIQPGAGATTKKDPLPHTVVWEYWNGSAWISFAPRLTKGPATRPDFESDGEFTFDVPEDMVPLKVNEQEARWMRVRLANGGYGFRAKVAWTDSDSGTPNEFTYVVPQPPALAEFRLCYVWEYGPFHAERVLAYNDFQYQDRTEEARWPGQTFQPYQPVGDATPALYLGFDKQLPVDRLNLYFDIVEQRDETLGPELLWQYWNGFAWRDLAVEDETRHLRVPGLLGFIAAADSQPLARFGTSLHWLRGRLKEDGPPGEPTMNGIFLNAVWAVQRQTTNNDPLGASSGQPNQVFPFRQFPVLPGERVEIRELNGPRANVEWRILAREVLGDARAIQELEALLGREGTQTEIEKGDLRLIRDRKKQVVEVWVRWQERPHFFLSGRGDRHYVIERARGRLHFGDGDQGKVPPLGSAILARQYRTGGGRAGNVGARTITQLLGGVAGVEAVFNPRPAEGGADVETLEALSTRGPQTLRHRGRALLGQDYETLAREASPAVVVARAIPSWGSGGRRGPGWVTLLIIPQSDEPRPWPSFGLREQIRKYIEARAPATLAAASQIYITGPDYLPIDVEATIIPLDPAEAGAVDQRAREALGTFLHPLRGGPEGRGWELGRDVFLSDVATVLERVEGVDFVKELDLLLNGVSQGERVALAEDRIVVAGEIRVKLLMGQ